MFFLLNFISVYIILHYLTPEMLKFILFFSASMIVAGMDAFVVTVFVGIRTKFFLRIPKNKTTLFFCECIENSFCSFKTNSTLTQTVILFGVSEVTSKF